MPAEHHDLILLVATRNLSDYVVRRGSFREKFVSNVELESHRRALAQYPDDAAEIFVAQNNRRQCLFRIRVFITERSYLSVLATRVVDPDLRFACDEELVELVPDLPEG